MRIIYLFPYGGGGAASYRAFAKSFPQDVGTVIPVEIPGRGKRAAESFATSIEECAALTLGAVNARGEDYILHGHCMGALLAFEAIKLIEADGRPPPRFMVASGRNAPRHTNDLLLRVAELDDRSLFAELQALSAIPEGLSFAMAQQSLTVMRGDHAMFCGYDPGATRIAVPILALAGRSDRLTNPSGLVDWEDYTTQYLVIEWFDGEHFFIFDQSERVAQAIKQFGDLVNSRPAMAPSVPA